MRKPSGRLLLAAFLAFPLLFAKIAPGLLSGERDETSRPDGFSEDDEGTADGGSDGAGEADPADDGGRPVDATAQTAVEEQAAIDLAADAGIGQGDVAAMAVPVEELSTRMPLPDLLGGRAVTADTLDDALSAFDQLRAGTDPKDLVALYRANREVMDGLVPRGLSQPGDAAHVGAELSLVVDDEGRPAAGSGLSTRIVSEIGVDAATGGNQLTIGLLDMAGDGPGTAERTRAGVIYSYTTPRGEAPPDHLPDLDDPRSLPVGSTLRMMPVEASWPASDSASSDYYEESVSLRFGALIQVTRPDEDVVEVGLGDLDLDLDAGASGLRTVWAGSRLAAAAGPVSGTARLRSQRYELADPAAVAAYGSALAYGDTGEDGEPTTAEVVLGQFNVNCYLAGDVPPSGDSGQVAAAPGSTPGGGNISADLTRSGQVSYDGYAIAEVSKEPGAGMPVLVSFGRYAPGVELLGEGTLVADEDGQGYVERGRVRMHIPDLDVTGHEGTVAITDEQLSALNGILGSGVRPVDVSPTDLYPGLVAGTVTPSTHYALARGIGAMLDMGITSDEPPVVEQPPVSGAGGGHGGHDSRHGGPGRDHEQPGGDRHDDATGGQGAGTGDPAQTPAPTDGTDPGADPAGPDGVPTPDGPGTEPPTSPVADGSHDGAPHGADPHQDDPAHGGDPHQDDPAHGGDPHQDDPAHGGDQDGTGAGTGDGGAPGARESEISVDGDGDDSSTQTETRNGLIARWLQEVRAQQQAADTAGRTPSTGDVEPVPQEPEDEVPSPGDPGAVGVDEDDTGAGAPSLGDPGAVGVDEGETGAEGPWFGEVDDGGSEAAWFGDVSDPGIGVPLDEVPWIEVPTAADDPSATADPATPPAGEAVGEEEGSDAEAPGTGGGEAAPDARAGFEVSERSIGAPEDDLPERGVESPEPDLVGYGPVAPEPDSADPAPVDPGIETVIFTPVTPPDGTFWRGTVQPDETDTVADPAATVETTADGQVPAAGAILWAGAAGEAGTLLDGVDAAQA